MRCSYCNEKIPKGMFNCPNCGEEAPFTSDESINETEGKVAVQDMDENDQEAPKSIWSSVSDDEIKNSNRKNGSNLFLALLSLIIAPVGIILTLINKKKNPRASKVYGLCTLISIVGIVSIASLLYMLGFFSFQDNKSRAKKAGTSNEQTEADEWKYNVLTVNEKEITLPCSYEKFAAVTGYKLSEKQEKQEINKSTVETYILKNEEGFTVQADIMNWTNSKGTLSEGHITKICLSDSMISKKNDKNDFVQFPGGITVGSSLTENKVIELLGKPTDTFIYEEKGYDYLTLTYCGSEELTNVNCYTICMVNGKVTELAIDAQE